MPLFLTISVEPLYGVPFVSKNNGKGTQSLKIAERYGFQYMSVGELLRKKMIHNATSNRKWSLIETTITEIKQKIMKIPDANGIVIDGFPRDVGQALSFEDQVSLCYWTHLHLKERLQKRAEQQGRPDDNPKAIDRRLTNFKQNTIPLVKYFQERGLIVTLDASGIPVAVRGLVQKHIDQISICAR
uniref:Adenylate kinase 5 n=1 Tax=Poecilia latipinna TaxID=48699 RepID=A0A3B3U267_9TELE